MIKTGLVSVTFRKLSPKEIIKLVAQSGLNGIEWGGDVHVPQGDLEKAAEVRHMTTEEGLKCISYGSYYRVGAEDEGFSDFKKVLDTAYKLEVPNIRIWAGNKASQEADEDWWKNVVHKSQCIGELANQAGIDISYEYHGGTLTDTTATANRLLQETDRKNIKSFWQPRVHVTLEENLKSLMDIMPYLTNIHVFQWKKTVDNTVERFLLSEGKDQWSKYFTALKENKSDHFALLEFVKDENVDNYIKDAQTLKELVGK